ncbi:MAG: alpha-N-acetylglucosaminidase [Planctomycetes bacterium]|nr:alpha-N-acetylglucosaminidase [Planctomycetota bacterium]
MWQTRIVVFWVVLGTVFVAKADINLPAPPSGTGGGTGASLAGSPLGAEDAARGLVRRVVPGLLDRLDFEVIPQENGLDVFELESREGKIVCRGSSAGAICSAFNWYLEHYCRCQVSWLGDQLDLPEPLPAVGVKVRRVSPHQYRYWLNYCAFSYSLAFWHWPAWERFIDWMALHGVNMPLAITGQEATWRAVGRRFGLTDAELAEFLPGPAYLPFGWMGCLDGWGGPLPASWIDQHIDLQKRILARQRELGMTPVLQGFTGHVPAAFRDKFPAAKFRELPKWGGFAGTTFIDPADPLFLEVGRAFIEEQTRLYGTDHYYASDTFIEMMPPSDDPAFLAGMGRSVYGAMSAADPQARWLMMGWIFINNARFWQPPQTKALFGAVPDDRLILIEMGGDKYLETEAYYGKPWIWATIRNYGNVVQLGGDLRHIVSHANQAMASSRRGRLCGSGAIMEGLGYDPAVFELVADLNWRDDITDVEAWLMDFIRHRYGRESERMSEAWKELLTSAYAQSGAGDGTVCMRPSLKPRRRGRTLANYDNAALARAARLMLDVSGDYGKVDTYRYDVVNVVRQTLANSARPLYDEIVRAYTDKDRRRLEAAGTRLCELISDVDTLLGTRREFLLGGWLADAKRWATTEDEARRYEWNARTQITLWGPPDSRLDGYARKHWAGLVADFYRERWRLFLRRMDEALAAGRAFDGDAFEKECQTWDDGWTRSTNAYPVEPAGDSVAIAGQLLAKYWDELTTRPGP